tara:strand:- start:62 stop:520 length:459 start_codon:yes stop_codon:yes gene_type:complete
MNTKVLDVCLEIINNKNVTDEVLRKNYKEVVWEYIADLSTLQPINVPMDNKAYNQKQYLLKLISLGDRYSSIGNDSLPNDTEKIDIFLKKLQDMIKDYLHEDLAKTFYSLRKEYYSSLAFNQRGNEGIAPPTVIANLREQAMRNINRNNNLG